MFYNHGYALFDRCVQQLCIGIMTKVASPTTITPKTITLALGGARSGKTDYAERHALSLAEDGRIAVYVATGQAFDEEMAARIKRHQHLRSDRFQTVEEPLDLVQTLASFDENHIVLIDSIGVWITNHMIAEHNLDTVIDQTLSALAETKASVVLVSDEVGMGIVPEGAMSRAFRDHIGMMNQRVGQIADTVAFLVAGLPMMIKSNGQNK